MHLAIFSVSFSISFNGIPAFQKTYKQTQYQNSNEMNVPFPQIHQINKPRHFHLRAKTSPTVPFPLSTSR